MSKQYGQILDLPEDKQFAWDTYMLFDSEADWTQSPPNPTEWMHQMSQVFGRNHPRWLNGERFRQAVESKID